jgi:hypothetical protein
MVGHFIRKVQRHQPGHPVWYLIENVVLQHDDLQAIEGAFGGSTPIRIDSFHFSPCKRNREYFINVSVGWHVVCYFWSHHTQHNSPSFLQYYVNVQYDEDFEHQASCDTFIDDDFALPQTVARNTDIYHSNWSKANTFMASKVRLDDDRMVVVKEKRNKRGMYLVRTFTVNEREKMMGLPVGYVSEPRKYKKQCFLMLQHGYIFASRLS